MRSMWSRLGADVVRRFPMEKSIVETKHLWKFEFRLLYYTSLLHLTNESNLLYT